MARRRGDSCSGRIHARKNGSPGGRTEWARRIRVRKEHPALRETFDVGRLVVSAAGKAGIHPAEIVGKDENDVGLISVAGNRQTQTESNQ